MSEVDGDAFSLDGASATLTDFVVRDVGGAGVAGASGAVVTAERGAVLGAAGPGFSMHGADLEATDVAVDGAGAPRGGFDASMGVQSYDGDLVLRRALLRNNRFAGLDLELGGERSVEDVWVTRVVADPDFAAGYALPLTTWGDGEPVALTLRRVALEGGAGAGLSGNDLALDAEDLSITGIDSMEGSGAFGMGLDVAQGTLALRRVSVSRVRGAGVRLDAGELVATDLAVSGVRTQACAADACADDRSATGLFVGRRATATLDRLLLEDAGVGLQVMGQGEASNVVLRRDEVGVDAGDGFDLGPVTFVGTDEDHASSPTAAPPTVW